VTFEATPASLHHLLFGERGQEAGCRPAFLVGGLRQGGPDHLMPGSRSSPSSSSMRAASILSVAFMRLLHGRGDLVVDGERGSVTTTIGSVMLFGGSVR